MNCPICNVTLLMGDKQGIEVDYCPDCRGIWLEKGKLEKIIERSASYSPNQRPYRTDGEHSKEHYEHDDQHKKKKGFWELFD